MTHFEFDAAVNENTAGLKKAESVVFIQCVGSRTITRPYCSRVCCTHSVKSAIGLKKLNPDMNVFILHRDIRTYGDRELLYKQARDIGVIFIRYTLEQKPVVTDIDGELFVELYDTAMRDSVQIYADYLVLAAAVVPNDVSDLSELYKCGVNTEGFLNEAHPKLRPVDMSVDGLFLAGMCHFPKPIDEAIAQAKAAVSRAGVILARDEMQLDAVKSKVTDLCDGCGLCVDVCPYRSIQLETVEINGRTAKRVTSDPALCRGCGLCEATCPKEGIVVHGFTKTQLKAQIAAALETA
jgi:heterodisulfide reductase subunit A